MLKRILFLASLLMFKPLLVSAELLSLGERYFERVGSTKEGVGGIITSIEQTEDGFLWIGTQGGLIKYDGYVFKKFMYIADDATSLSSNFILTIWAAPDGKLWVGTKYAGVSVYDPVSKTFKRYTHKTDDSNSLSNNHVRSITGDNEGGVWVATMEGLNYLPHNAEHFIHYRHDTNDPNSLPSNKVFSLLFTGDNRLWVGTGNGAAVLNRENNSFSNSIEKSENKSALQGKTIYRMFQDRNNRIWLGTNKNGAYWFDENNHLEKIPLDTTVEGHLRHKWVFGFTQPNDNEIWIATYGGGISIFNTKLDRITEYVEHSPSNSHSINSNDIGALKTDKSGLVWVGTWGGGLSMHNAKNKAIRSFYQSAVNNKSITHSSIMSLIERDNGNIWLGTQDNGIDIFDPLVGLIDGIREGSENYVGFTENFIMSLAQSQNDKNIVWIGTRKAGVFKYDISRKKFTHYTTDNGLPNNYIKKIIIASNSDVWIGTNSGLARFNTKDESFTHIATIDQNDKPLNANIIIMAKQEDTLWVSTSIGLFYIEENSDYLMPIKPTDKALIKSTCTSVYSPVVDHNNELWVGCNNGLLKLTNREQQNVDFEKMPLKPDGTRVSFSKNLLFDDEGNMWHESAVRMKETGELITFNQSDGADIGQSWAGSALKTKSGLLIFGGPSGLLVINPSLFKPWDYQPPIRVTGIKINNEPYHYSSGQVLDLVPGTKSMSVTFSALDYSSPESNQYRYMLEGYDHEWIEADSDHRVVSYTNLDPGSYRLLLNGSNRVGEFNQVPFALTIKQRPAWYQALWFKFMLAFLITFIFYTYHQLRLRHLKQQKKLLREQVIERTEDIFMLSEIGRDLTSAHSLDQVIEQVYKSVNKVLDAHVFLLGIIQHNKNTLRIALTVENKHKKDPWELSLNDTERPGVWCVNNKKEVIILHENDRKKYTKFERPAVKMGKPMSTVVYQPLIMGNKVVGCLSLQSPHEGAYNEEQLDMIRTLASYTAIAVANALGYASLEQANGSLEHAVNNLEANQKELKIARDEARLATKSKSDFLASMSHEIRTPMHGIIGLTKLIQDTSLDPEQKEFVDKVDFSANNLLCIVNEVMDFSKVEAGKIELENIPVSLTELIFNLETLVDSLAKDKGLKFKCTIDPDMRADYLGDPVRLNQILLNLCSNAIKFTPQGTVSVLVKSVESESNKNVSSMVFEVIDEGIGIEPKVIETLFENFSQADSSTTRKFGGTGLGLAISKKLAQLMNGDIRVTSSVGKGSCFAFTVDLELLDINQMKSLVDGQLCKPQRFLVVSQKTNQRFVEDMNKLDHQLTHARGSQEAIELLDAQIDTYDVIIIDWENVDCQPIDFLTKLQSIKSLENTKLIVATEAELVNIKIAVKGYGVNEVIAKPISLINLNRKLSRLFAASKKSNRESDSLKNVSLLVVEDNKINQIIAEKFLKSFGGEVVLANNGIEAIELLDKQEFDIVLMDIMMPKMGGEEATKKIRNQSKYDEMPIIAMTANVLSTDIESYMEAGMNGYVTKPFDAMVILEKIKGLLG